ncbi:hypothetical protein ISCGN_028307 [Ixodes scapularis]
MGQWWSLLLHPVDSAWRYWTGGYPLPGAEVGKAVEDLLASESAGSASSSCESHNNSCPELYGCEADHEDNAPDAYASLSVPRAKRNTNGIVARKTDSPEQDDLWHGTGPTTDQKTKDDCTWDAYYGWKSLQLSRPPSGDAHLLSIYTERLVEAVNDSFGLHLQEPSSKNARDQLDFKVKPTSETGLVASSSENVPESPPAPPNSQKNGSLTPDSSLTTIHGALTFERDVRRAERADSEKSERCVRDVDADAANVKELIDRCSSWPSLRSFQDASVGVQLPNRSGSYPGLSKTVNPFCDTEDLVGSDQVLSYDGSLYKNQQLYYEPEDLPDCAGAPAVSVTESVTDKEKGQDFTDIELRIVDPDEAFDDLPELFIREDDRDNDSHAVPPIQDVSLSLNSPTLGRAQGRLNPYTIKVIANHASTPDEVFATVCTLEAKLASRLPPLEIDEGDPDTGTWSSTSTGHSTSTLSRHDLEKFLKNVEPPHEPPSWPQDAVTQTTPVISRSSSFTWVADLGEDVGSSKESLRIATQTTTTNTTTPNSPSPVSSSSSCEAPPTPLTPRTSPSSQEVSSDQSEVVNPIRSRSSKLQDSSSPSMPTLANEDCGKSENYRQLSLDEKTQVQSLSRSAIKGHGGNSSEAASAALSWAANQQLGQKASSAPVLLKNKPPTSFSGSFGKKRAQLFNATASAGNTPEEEAKVFVQARSQSAKNIKGKRWNDVFVHWFR